MVSEECNDDEGTRVAARDRSRVSGQQPAEARRQRMACKCVIRNHGHGASVVERRKGWWMAHWWE